MKQLAIVLSSVLLFSSCAAFKSPDFHKVEIGMTKEQVIKRLGNKYKIISAKKYDDGILEIYQFLNVAPVYADSNNPYNWLFFFNNKN